MTADAASRGSVGRAAALSAVLITGGTALGFLRDLTMAHLFGAGGSTDAFLVAWTIPETVSPLLIEDAMALLLVPAVTRLLARGDPLRPFAGRTLPRLALGLAAVSAVLTAGAPAVVRLLAPGLAEPGPAVACVRLTAVTVVTFGVAGFMSATLRAHHRFGPPAAIYLAYNAGILALIAGLSGVLGVTSAAIGVACGSVLMVAVQTPAFLRCLRGPHPPNPPREAQAGSEPEPPEPAPDEPVRDELLRDACAGGRGAWNVPVALARDEGASSEAAREVPAPGEPACDALVRDGCAPEPLAWNVPERDVRVRDVPGSNVPARDVPLCGGLARDVSACDDRVGDVSLWDEGASRGAAGDELAGDGFARGRLALAAVVPVAVYTVTRQAQVLVERFLGSGLAAGSISQLNYAQKVAQVPMVLALLIVTVTFPRLARASADGDTGRVADRIRRDLVAVSGLVLCAAAYLVACAPAVVRLLFEHGAFTAADARGTAAALRVYALGLWGHTAVGLAARAFFAHGRPTWRPAGLIAAGLAVTAAAGGVFAAAGGTLALAAANAAGITVAAVLLLAGLRRHVAPVPLRRAAADLARLLLAAAGAAAAGLLTTGALGGAPPLVPPLAGGAAVAGAFAALAAASSPAGRRRSTAHITAWLGRTDPGETSDPSDRRTDPPDAPRRTGGTAAPGPGTSTVGADVPLDRSLR